MSNSQSYHGHTPRPWLQHIQVSHEDLGAATESTKLKVEFVAVSLDLSNCHVQSKI